MQVLIDRLNAERQRLPARPTRTVPEARRAAQRKLKVKVGPIRYHDTDLMLGVKKSILRGKHA